MVGPQAAESLQSAKFSAHARLPDLFLSCRSQKQIVPASKHATNMISNMQRNSDFVLILQASVPCTDTSGWQPSVAVDLDSGSPEHQQISLVGRL